MSLIKGWPLISALCATLVVASCGKSDRGSLSKKEPPAAQVDVSRVEVHAMARSIPVTGTLAAREDALLSAKVAGRIQLLPVDIGSVVRQGDLLAQVEPKDYELGLQQAAAALAQARVSLGLSLDNDNDQVELVKVSTVQQAKAVRDEATKNRDRVKDLTKSGVASESELDTVEATYKVALTRYETAMEEARTRVAALAQRRAEFELAQKRLADASVRAPFDGVVQLRSANVGEFVASGAPVLQLVKTDPLRLQLEVPERESLLVRTGQVVRLFIEGDTNIYSGRIARLSPALEQESRMLLLEADVPAQGSLRPGLFARARIVIRENEPVLTVPPSAIITFAGLEKVIVAQAGKALEKVVVTGRRENGLVEIVSGLEAGELVVLNPGGLRTGLPLIPRDQTQSQDSSSRSEASGR